MAGQSSLPMKDDGDYPNKPNTFILREQELMTTLSLKPNPILKTARSLGLLLLTIGIDVRKFQSIRHIPKYFSDRAAFKRAGGEITEIYPILGDFAEQAGSAKGHYFHQDLLVATFVNKANPIRHIDIGSRVDGFVAHVASFREIEVMDIRPLTDVGHANIKFTQADLMAKNEETKAIADSVSCLHAIEHFGLGRYGDPIDPQGHLKAFKNLCQMLKPQGVLYISFPIGQANSVYFNGYKSFHPTEILNWSKGIMDLVRFDFVDDNGDLNRDWPLIESIPVTKEGCGIYTLRKI
jgi:SAM-dependent methyltransferase